MKVLFISNLYPPLAVGGYEQICADVAQGLHGRGHDIRVLTSRFRRDDSPQNEPSVDRLLKLKSGSGLPGPQLTDWFGRNRIDLEWYNSRIVRRAITRLSPDTIMFWNGGNMGRSLLSAATRTGRNVIFYLEDPWLAPVLIPANDKGWPHLRRVVYHKLLQAVRTPIDAVSVNRLIFASRSLQTQYAQMGVDTISSAVIPNGLNPALFSFRPQHILQHKAGEPHHILYSGRIAPQKGVSTLVAAVAEVRKVPGLETTKLSLLGSMESKEYRAKLQAQIVELDLLDAVKWIPYRPRHELVEVYSRHDVLAFPSEWEEPFGLALIEAMATGLPVVSSLRGAPGEIVRDGKNALAFQAGEPDDLARKLVWVMTHPEEAAAIGRAASEEVSRCYSLDRQVDAVEAYLQGGVSQGPSRQQDA